MAGKGGRVRLHFDVLFYLQRDTMANGNLHQSRAAPGWAGRLKQFLYPFPGPRAKCVVAVHTSRGHHFEPLRRFCGRAIFQHFHRFDIGSSKGFVLRGSHFFGFGGGGAEDFFRVNFPFGLFAEGDFLLGGFCFCEKFVHQNGQFTAAVRVNKIPGSGCLRFFGGAGQKQNRCYYGYGYLQFHFFQFLAKVVSGRFQGLSKMDLKRIILQNPLTTPTVPPYNSQTQSASNSPLPNPAPAVSPSVFCSAFVPGWYRRRCCP